MGKPLLVAVAALLPWLGFTADFAADLKYEDVRATVIAVNPLGSTVTIKLPDGSTKLSRVEGDAVMALGSIKTGDRIIATCKENARGQHLAITKIKKRR